MGRRVVVTGIGLVTPLGNDLSTVWRSLAELRHGVRPIDSFECSHLPVRIAAHVKERADCSAFKSIQRDTPDFIRFALCAARDAVADAQCLDEMRREPTRAGVAVGVGMSSIPEILDASRLIESAPRGYRKVTPYFVPRVLPNLAAGHVAIEFGLQGPNHAASTACAAGAHAIGDSFRMVKYGDADIMLAGGSEAAINAVSIAGFTKIRALASSFNDAAMCGLASRPFDVKREGFVMGEGAGILVLEELDSAKARGARIYCELVGYGMSGDAYHITAPSPQGVGARQAMLAAMREGGVSCGDVGYVNAHATSTPLGDEIEGSAIAHVFYGSDEKKQAREQSGSPLYVSSTKGAVGHLLGAAGAVEAAFTCMALHTKQVPPTLNFEESDVVYPFEIVAGAARTVALRVALSNSFGFGGTNASLCMKHYESGTA
ncbi:3-oxoacyl-acyl-carrier-protein synthase, mitochondrial [Porphyridium purpureum]|uniref:3-oxoacyl-[acyl-carrier-protein] synthase n=1 Tax=Porphyridium purpureum TaxID=35688 RepID=A0A5J4Z1V9_PORPP|nr:3-oxoacyl-acyl-carrier-protein synthase, mitochondrial [Porphyridium purpureum]|eukprot:POR4063..scf208_2